MTFDIEIVWGTLDRNIIIPNPNSLYPTRMIRRLDSVIFATVIDEAEAFLVFIVKAGLVMTLSAVNNSLIEISRLGPHLGRPQRTQPFVS